MSPTGTYSPISRRSKFVSYVTCFCRAAEAARPVGVDPELPSPMYARCDAASSPAVRAKQERVEPDAGDPLANHARIGASARRRSSKLTARAHGIGDGNLPARSTSGARGTANRPRSQRTKRECRCRHSEKVDRPPRTSQSGRVGHERLKDYGETQGRQQER